LKHEDYYYYYLPAFLRWNIGSIISIMPSHLWYSARFSSWTSPVHPVHYTT